jgi:hypothetical protein
MLLALPEEIARHTRNPAKCGAMLTEWNPTDAGRPAITVSGSKFGLALDA